MMIDRTELDEQITKIMQDKGAFFAFGDKKFNERKAERSFVKRLNVIVAIVATVALGVQYVSLHSGMIVPMDNVEGVVSEIKLASAAHIERMLAQHSPEELIDYELGNHKCQISGDIDDAASALKPFGIEREQVIARYPEFIDKQDFHGLIYGECINDV